MKNVYAKFVKMEGELKKINLKNNDEDVNLMPIYFKSSKILTSELLQKLGIKPELLLGNYDLASVNTNEVWSLVRQFTF